MNKRLFTAAAAVIMVATSGMAAQAAEPDSPNAMDKMFVMKVGQGNIAEIQSSRLALKNSKDDGVKKIATMLIKQHSDAQMALKQSVAKLNIKVPNDTDPMHKAEARKLCPPEGEAFDKAYMKAQVRDHYKTIGLFNQEMTKGRNSAIQGFASRYLPDIQTHTQHITAQAGKEGIPTAMAK